MSRQVPAWPDANQRRYAAMVERMHATVGRIRQKLEELKLADRTFIVFASDNGGRVPRP